MSEKLDTKRFMVACGLTHPNSVSRLISRGIITPEREQGDKHRTNYFTDADVKAYFNYQNAKPAQRKKYVDLQKVDVVQMQKTIEDLTNKVDMLEIVVATSSADIENLKKIVKHLATTKGNPQ